ncbi:MAG TPA: thermonuclease family protein [Vicinamibacteria bacterium]
MNTPPRPCPRVVPPAASAFLLATALVAATALPVPRALAQAPADRPAARASEPRPEPKPQPRPHGMRVPVDPARVQVDDGDTVVVRWSRDESETVRILGIDTPETRHLEHDLPYGQSFGPEARAFARGAFAAATQIELLRSSTLDPFGRSLGYLFLNGRNYSVLVVRARLAAESVTFYGDNGLPREAAEVLAAAKAAGPLPFEPPHAFRARMRELSRWMKEKGLEAEQ